MIRKYFSWYVRGFPAAAELRRHLMKVESLADIDVVFGRYAEEHDLGQYLTS